jgi:hypothetical protein
MKIIKFPEHKMKRPWLIKMRNSDKRLLVNAGFSLASVIVGLAIVWFILHKMNA